MTRIIAGTAGGRTLHTPRGRDTRPTTDRVREALFSRVEALMDLAGAVVLDLYAGSGALGLEALSRGAGQLVAVERHRATAALVRSNARELGLATRTTVHAVPVERFLAAVEAVPCDLVLLDPPYPTGEQELTEVLGLLVTGGWLAPEALVVLERSSRSPRPTWPPGLVHLDTRTYGETALHLADLAAQAADGEHAR